MNKEIRNLIIITIIVAVITIQVDGSAIPMWEFLSRDEKVSYYISMDYNLYTSRIFFQWLNGLRKKREKVENCYDWRTKHFVCHEPCICNRSVRYYTHATCKFHWTWLDMYMTRIYICKWNIRSSIFIFIGLIFIRKHRFA